jgi:hypothetical protein
MKTSMEWLIEMLHSPVCNTFINGQHRIIPHQLILDAKEKHKKEIIEAYIMGSISLTSRTEAEEYYNETYNQKGIDVAELLYNIVKKEVDELNK